MKIFTIPNFITLGNLLCGCLGIMYAFQGDLKTAGIALFIALVLDFFDGFVARLLKSSSEIGKELDSLADVVSFGVLPAFIMMHLVESLIIGDEFHKFIPLIIALASALRLAKFNVDTRQSESFIGLPTPANGMIVASIPFILDQNNFLSTFISDNPISLIIYSLVISILLNAEIPLFALKFKEFSWAKNNYKYLFAGFSILMVLLLKMTAIPIIILSYILLSMVLNMRKKA